MTDSGCDVGIASPVVLDALTRWVNLQCLCVCVLCVCVCVCVCACVRGVRFLSLFLYGVHT
jgi:hypothetical protein